MAGINASAITSILTTIASTPGAWTVFTNHLSTANEMQAVQLLDSMQTNPALAPNLLPALLAIPNLPPAVASNVQEALTQPPNFQMLMANAKAALLAAAGTGGIFSGL